MIVRIRGSGDAAALPVHNPVMRLSVSVAFSVTVFLTFNLPAAAQDPSPHDRLAREIYQELVNSNTSQSITYGISGIFEDIDDVRAHGRDERLGVAAFYEGREFLYRLVRALSK
jgi:hypothetical protein